MPEAIQYVTIGDHQKIEMALCRKDLVPFMAMVMVECCNVGLNVIFKAATLRGMSFCVFIVYSYVVATIFLLPFLFIFNRNFQVPPSMSSLLFRICLLGLTGFVAQMCSNTGIVYSSPTLASAMSNLVPAFTFLFAIIFRMEKLAWRSPSAKAKIIGTVLSITGACVVTLHDGPLVMLPEPPGSMSTSIHSHAMKLWVSNWVTGGIFLTVEKLLVPITYIIQAQILKEFPAELPIVFMYNASVMILSCIAGLMLERNSSAWKLRANVELVAVLYSGIFGSSTCTLIHTWGLRIKGPVYIAMFKPLSIAIATFMSFMFLNEPLRVKSFGGAIIISIGFYAVLWGKAKEDTREQFGVESMDYLAGERMPFLPTKSTRAR